MILTISMMMRKRPTQQVITDILLACQGNGANKTKIVYVANLNFRTVVPYLEGLSKDGLLEIVPGEISLFKITQKGTEALEHLKAIGELMPSFVLD